MQQQKIVEDYSGVCGTHSRSFRELFECNHAVGNEYAKEIAEGRKPLEYIPEKILRVMFRNLSKMTTPHHACHAVRRLKKCSKTGYGYSQTAKTIRKIFD